MHLLIPVDDFLVFSKTFDEHLQHLDFIFQKLRKANLALQPTKCHFAAQEVKYLGHTISEKGVDVHKAKIAAAADFTQPRNSKHVCSLGMNNY